MMVDEKKKEAKKSRYFIADGVYVSTKRGQLKTGTQVFEKDFPSGKKTIDELLKMKALVEK